MIKLCINEHIKDNDHCNGKVVLWFAQNFTYETKTFSNKPSLYEPKKMKILQWNVPIFTSHRKSDSRYTIINKATCKNSQFLSIRFVVIMQFKTVTLQYNSSLNIFKELRAYQLEVTSTHESHTYESWIIILSKSIAWMHYCISR